MKIKEDNFYYLIKDYSNPLKNRLNKQIYKNYVYNLFKYNQDYRKKNSKKILKNRNLMLALKALVLQ